MLNFKLGGVIRAFCDAKNIYFKYFKKNKKEYGKQLNKFRTDFEYRLGICKILSKNRRTRI